MHTRTGLHLTLAAVAVVCALAVAISAPARADDLEVDIGAQYRPRFELDKKSLKDLRGNAIASHRARIDVDLRKDGWQLRLQPQHVLIWGSESTDATAGPTQSLALKSGSFDMHQAYAGTEWGGGFWARIGRQEVNYQDQRLLGAVDWAQQGRSFDGVRLGYAHGDTWHADTLIAVLHEGGSYDEVLHAAQAGGLLGGVHVTGLALVEHSRRRFDGKRDFVRATPGLRALADWGKLNVDVAAYGQLGGYETAMGDVDILAYAVAAAAGYRWSALTLVGAVDWLSGDSNPADRDVETFDTLFATNHKFYGEMDYFLNLPVHTASLGLGDVYGGLRAVALGPIKGNAIAHVFLAAEDTVAGNRLFGTELDTSLVWKPAKVVTFVAGYGMFVAGDAFVDIGRAKDSGELGHWLWLQMDVML